VGPACDCALESGHPFPEWGAWTLRLGQEGDRRRGSPVSGIAGGARSLRTACPLACPHMLLGSPFRRI
jgi:hypothetical protein